ncbi:MAG TPA: hypothetical protein DEO85_06740 [Maritimibacter sp.]|nr:hypothetical protein [Maritimibacter sp.]
MNRMTLLAMGLISGLIAATTAQGQTNNCAPRERVLDQLSKRFGEARQSIGLAAGNRVVEMYASPDTGTWTLTMTLPTGLTCIIGAGESFERVDEEVTPAGQPA